MAEDARTNASLIGRLLEEISWEGNRVKLYRRGGLGMENVLTTEVLAPLDYLPRGHFLGQILRSAHGAERALAAAAAEIEQANLRVLPPELTLRPSGIIVQPDALLLTPSAYVLVEAKRIRRASFHPEQLAREYLAVLRESGTRAPILLLILGAPPPVVVTKRGPRRLVDAIMDDLGEVLSRTGDDGESTEALIDRFADVVSWITWTEIRDIVQRQLTTFVCEDPSVRGCVERLVEALSSAVATHS